MKYVISLMMLVKIMKFSAKIFPLNVGGPCCFITVRNDTHDCWIALHLLLLLGHDNSAGQSCISFNSSVVQKVESFLKKVL